MELFLFLNGKPSLCSVDSSLSVFSVFSLFESSSRDAANASVVAIANLACGHGAIGFGTARAGRCLETGHFVQTQTALSRLLPNPAHRSRSAHSNLQP